MRDVEAESWRRSRQSNTNVAICACVIGVVIVYFCVADIRLRYTAEDAEKTWPTTIGTLTDWDFKQLKKGDRLLNKELRIRYSYRVGGSEYSGNRISLASDSITDERLAPKLADQWPVGREIEIAYNPAAPAESCVKETMRFGAIVRIPSVAGIVIGLGLIVYAVVDAIQTSRRRNIIIERQHAPRDHDGSAE